MRLGVLDLCKRSRGVSAAQSMRETIELAAKAESYGYERYWLAEHHTPDAALSTPEILLPLVAARTRTLCVGAGGLLLRYRSPLAVAEAFLALGALFPGRIELGICRGPGADESTARALVDGIDAALSVESYRRKVRELGCLLSANDGVPPSLVGRAGRPQVWMLGSGLESIELARGLGLSHVLALFLGESVDRAAELFAYLRDGAHRSRTAIAVSVNVAPSSSAARSREEAQVREGFRPSNIVGDAIACSRELEELAQRAGVEEVLITTWCPDAQDRDFMLRALSELITR